MQNHAGLRVVVQRIVLEWIGSIWNRTVHEYYRGVQNLSGPGEPVGFCGGTGEPGKRSKCCRDQLGWVSRICVGRSKIASSNAAPVDPGGNVVPDVGH